MQVQYENAARFILTGIKMLLNIVQCQSDDEAVTRNFLSHIIGLIHKVTALKQRLHYMSKDCPSTETVEFFTNMQVEFRFEVYDRI